MISSSLTTTCSKIKNLKSGRVRETIKTKTMGRNKIITPTTGMMRGPINMKWSHRMRQNYCFQTATSETMCQIIRISTMLFVNFPKWILSRRATTKTAKTFRCLNISPSSSTSPKLCRSLLLCLVVSKTR